MKYGTFVALDMADDWEFVKPLIEGILASLMSATAVADVMGYRRSK